MFVCLWIRVSASREGSPAHHSAALPLSQSGFFSSKQRSQQRLDSRPAAALLPLLVGFRRYRFGSPHTPTAHRDFDRFFFLFFFFFCCFFGAWMDSASDPGRSGSDPPVTETPSSLETLRGEEHLTPARRHSSSGSSSSGSGYSKGKSSGLCATSNTHFHLHTHTQDTREPRGTFTQQPRRLRFVTPRTVTSSWAKRERAAAPLEEFEQCSECDGCDSEGCWFDSSEGEPETSPQTV